MRHVLLIVAWFVLVIGIFSYLLPNQFQRWSSSLASIAGTVPEPVSLAVGETMGYTRNLAESFAEYLVQAGHPVTLIETESEAAAGTLLREGNTNLAFLSGVNVPEAGVLQLAQFERAYVHVVIPMDMAAESFADVIDLNVGVAGIFSDGEAVYAAMIRELGLGGTTPTVNIRKLHPGEMASALRQGQVDVVVAILPLMAPEINQLLGTGYYRLLPIPEATAFSYRIPGLEKDFIPDSLYGPGRTIPPKSSSPFTTAAVPLYLMTHPGTDNEALMPIMASFQEPNWQALHGHVDLTKLSSNRIPIHPLALSGNYQTSSPASKISVFGHILMLLALFILLWQYYLEYQIKQRKALATQVRAIIESGDVNFSEEGPGLLVELARQMMDGQNRAMQHWLSGRYNTHQMQLLMSLYLGHSLQLLARYNMMPKDMSGNVHPQRRPWQPPEKSVEVEPLELPDTKRNVVPVADRAAHAFNKVPSDRPTVQNTAHAHPENENRVAEAKSEKHIAQNRPVTQPSLSSSQKKPVTSNQDRTEVKGEDITHEVLPSDYSGDIIAVRKRPRPNTEQEAKPPEEAQKTTPQKVTSEKKPVPIRKVDTELSAATAQTAANNIPEVNNEKKAPEKNTVKTDIAEQKQAGAREQVAPKNVSLPQSNPPRKRRKKRRLNKEDVQNNAEALRQSNSAINTASSAKPGPEKEPQSDSKSGRKEPENSSNDQMMLF